MEESKIESDFDRFWEFYPPRKGDRGKTPARALFDKAIKSGVDPENIIWAAKRYAESEAENLNTPYIMQAQRWLRNKRWVDFSYENTQHKPTTEKPQFFIHEGSSQWKAWQKYKKTPCVNFGWWFPTEWPPQEDSE